MNSLADLIKKWDNSPDGHKNLHEVCCKLVNETEFLKEHRDFVETNVFGFGERSFQWMWNLLVKEMPQEFSFLEIGVFKGQILSLIELLANKQGKKATRYGITPLSSMGGVWESDYLRDIEFIHDKFNLAKDYKIIKGDSTDPEIIKQAQDLKLDLLYIDGGHTFEIASSDIKNYSLLVKPGGYLVIDDCCNEFHMPFGFFAGIREVTQAVQKADILRKNFNFLFSLVHIKVWQRR